MTWIDDHSPEAETEQERIEREQYEAEMDRIDLMRRINELQHELEAERGWSERFERQRDEAEKRVAELEAANRRLSEALHDIHQLTRKPAGDVRAEDWRRIGWIAGVALGADADGARRDWNRRTSSSEVKSVAELEAAAATEPACNCEAARGAYGHWLSCEKCR